RLPHQRRCEFESKGFVLAGGGNGWVPKISKAIYLPTTLFTWKRVLTITRRGILSLLWIGSSVEKKSFSPCTPSKTLYGELGLPPINIPLFAGNPRCVHRRRAGPKKERNGSNRLSA
ncbi:unnamed protein product, partial [Phaeothamnion confervicola]